MSVNHICLHFENIAYSPFDSLEGLGRGVKRHSPGASKVPCDGSQNGAEGLDCFYGQGERQDVMEWAAPATSIEMCQNAGSIEELRMSESDPVDG